MPKINRGDRRQTTPQTFTNLVGNAQYYGAVPGGKAWINDRRKTFDRRGPTFERMALESVEEWWLSEANAEFRKQGAPACIFLVREAISK